MMGVRDDVPLRPQDGQSIHKYKKLYILTWICVIVTSLLVSSAAVVVIVQTGRADRADVLTAINQVATNIPGQLSAVQEKFDNLEEKVSKVEDVVTARNKLKLCSHGKGCELTIRLEAMTHCYKLIEERTTWADARKKCVSLGGFLAEIHNHVSLEYVKRVVDPGKVRLWLGASDQGKEGTWTWVTSNKRLSVEDWNTTEPNNKMKEEHCLEMDQRRGDKAWNDRSCDDKLAYICQRDGDNCEGWLEQE